jgi:hypothetical protein
MNKTVGLFIVLYSLFPLRQEAAMFSKPNAIVYVRHNGLIVAGKKLTPARLTFNTEQLENMEILDVDGFTDALRSFFVEHDLKGKHVLMVLDDSVVFAKSISISSDSKPADLAQDFIDAMPLNPGQRACLRVGNESDLKLYGTNGDLYVTIAEALDEAGAAKLLAITPATAYPAPESGKQQLAAAVQQYVNDTSVRASANFQNTALV